MQKISLIAQSVSELFHREKVHDDNDNDANPPWIIVRDGIYSVADKKKTFRDIVDTERNKDNKFLLG